MLCDMLCSVEVSSGFRGTEHRGKSQDLGSLLGVTFLWCNGGCHPSGYMLGVPSLEYFSAAKAQLPRSTKLRTVEP
jgi:hypothetical protein